MQYRPQSKNMNTFGTLGMNVSVMLGKNHMKESTHLTPESQLSQQL